MYLHQHKSFKDLLLRESEERAIDPILIEKDYWIMHCLYGLQRLGFHFELKGGTSLSKAYKIIDRFSEDIDIHIHPGARLGINENPKNTNANNVARRLALLFRSNKRYIINMAISIRLSTSHKTYFNAPIFYGYIR